jgi:hypothetical protein
MKCLLPFAIDGEVCNPDPIGLAIAQELEAFFKRFLILTVDQYFVVLVLWTLFSHSHDAFGISPILAITSPTKRSGKTRVLEALSGVVPRPLQISGPTGPAIFRAIERYNPTLLIDEGDALFRRRNEDVRSILDTGFSRSSAWTLRADGVHPTWAPKAVASIGLLPDTLQDRAITIRMLRKQPGQKVEQLRQDELADMDLKTGAAGWASEHMDALGTANPAVPEGLNDRQADCWRPLFAIADILGGDWPRRVREVAVTLSSLADDDDDDVAVRLLADLAIVFAKAERMASPAVVKALIAMPDREWSTCFRGQPLTELRLAQLLRGFGVRPQQWGEGPKAFRRKARGYYRADFRPIFERYVRQTPDVPAVPGTLKK